MGTKEADEQMLTYNITNWAEAQKQLNWRQALGIATQSQERWTRKATEWNPGLVIPTRTQRRAGRPAKRWEDDSNEFVKDEYTEATQSNDLKKMIHSLLLQKTSTNGKREKDNTPNTLSTIEEPNPTPFNNTASPATTSRRRPSALRMRPSSKVSEGAEACGDHTCPVLGQSRGRSSYEQTARTQRSSYVVQHAVYRGIHI